MGTIKIKKMKTKESQLAISCVYSLSQVFNDTNDN